MRTCYACGKSKPDSSFYPRVREAGGEAKYFSVYCKPCDISRIGEMKKRTRALAVEYGGGKCKKCGYARCKEALEFHHRNPKQKDFPVSKIRSLSDKVKKELDKCDLLCANCHREAHYLILDVVV